MASGSGMVSLLAPLRTVTPRVRSPHGLVLSGRLILALITLTIDASGDATFSGDLKLATAFNTSLIKAKEVINANHLVLSSNNNAEHLVIDSSGNATFSGAVTSSAPNGSVAVNPTDQGATSGHIRFKAGSGSWFNIGKRASSNSLQINSGADFDNPANGGLTIDATGNATFSGTVDAAGFTVNGQPIGGGGLPDGDFTHNGKITATDFIATSDERVKDNITTAPVGLIDSLKGREWDWKESGEKGSGVVAQELEQVLPHLVHEDEAGMKSVSYNGLVAYLIEEVKALKAEVEALK